MTYTDMENCIISRSSIFVTGDILVEMIYSFKRMICLNLTKFSINILKKFAYFGRIYVSSNVSKLLQHYLYNDLRI